LKEKLAEFEVARKVEQTRLELGDLVSHALLKYADHVLKHEREWDGGIGGAGLWDKGEGKRVLSGSGS